MANLTRAQLQTLNAMALGEHDRLDTKPRMQPGYSVDEIYSGILPPPPLDNRPIPKTSQGWWDSKNSVQPGMRGRGIMVPAARSDVGTRPSWSQFDDQVNDPASWNTDRLKPSPGNVDPVYADFGGVNPVLAFGSGSAPGDNHGTGPLRPDGQGLQAISDALNVPLPRARPDAPAGFPTRAGGMQWEAAAPPSQAPAGDPWGGMRIGNPAVLATPGMVTGGGNAPAPAKKPVMIAPPKLSPEVHARLMAQQSADQRGQNALRASGMIDQFGMIT